MADDQENTALNNEDEFSKTDDKQNIADAGVGDGVNFDESLPGGGSDNKRESAVTAGDRGNNAFDHRTEDDGKS